MPLTWHDYLGSATTQGDVVAVAKDFVAQLSPDEINSLPERCRPGKFFDAHDVTSYAFLLVRHNCEGDARTSVLVHRLVEFFSTASMRLSKIMGGDDAQMDDSRRSA